MTRSRRMPNRAAIIVGAVAVLSLVLTSCGQFEAQLPFVDLNQREALPEAASPRVEPLRIAVAAVLSPEGNIDSYADLAEHLGQYLDLPVEFVQRRTYAEVNDLIAGGAVDVAFVCTSAYVAGSDRGELELLVAPEVNGESVYYSVLIVPAASTADTLDDLEGTVFAFTDPMSHTGRMYPTHLVQQIGHHPETFFSSTFFTYSHDRAIQAVADGVADGAAVDSLVLDYAVARDPGLLDRVKLIHRSPAFGIPPVVVPTGLSVDLRRQLEVALLELHTSADGRAILAQIGVDKFVLAADADYASVRALVKATGLDA